MKIQLSRIIFVRVEKFVDVDTVEELITATEEFDDLPDDLHVTTPYFDDDVYLTVEGTVPNVDEYSPLCSFISDNYSDDEWFDSVDEYIDYVNTHVEHPLHGTDNEESYEDSESGALKFDLQRFADEDDNDGDPIKEELIDAVNFGDYFDEDEPLDYTASLYDISDRLATWIIKATNHHACCSKGGLQDAVLLYYGYVFDLDEEAIDVIRKNVDDLYEIALDAIVGCNRHYTECDVAEMAREIVNDIHEYGEDANDAE